MKQFFLKVYILSPLLPYVLLLLLGQTLSELFLIGTKWNVYLYQIILNIQQKRGTFFCLHYVSLTLSSGVLLYAGVKQLSLRYSYVLQRFASGGLLLTPLLAGLFSSLFSMPPSHAEKSEEGVYLVAVKDPIRIVKNEQVTSTFTIIKKVSVYNERVSKRKLYKKLLQRTQRQAFPRSMLCKGVLLPWRNSNTVKEGDLFFVKAKLLPVRNNTSLFSYDRYLYRRGITFTCKIEALSLPIKRREQPLLTFRKSIAEAIDKKLEQHGFLSNTRALFLALVLGKRDGMSIETEVLFKDLGIAHLLVLSGFQITLFFGVIYKVVLLCCRQSYWLLLSCNCKVLSHCLSVICASFFALFAGFESSCLRAEIAMVISSSIAVKERYLHSVHTLLLSLFFMSCISPGCFLEPGVQLTYGALSVIWYLTSKRESLSFAEKLSQYVFICGGCSLAGSIISYLWFGQSSLVIAFHDKITIIFESIGIFRGAIGEKHNYCTSLLLQVSAYTITLIIGIFINLVFGTLLSIIGTLGGIMGIFLFLTGIDRGGRVMSVVVEAIDYSIVVLQSIYMYIR
jgi:ComEC/Rec2-related protein